MGNSIVVKNLSAGYGAVKVLHGVSVDVQDGETVALLGTNGNGKSTLLKCIMGLVPPDSGEIYFESDGDRIDLVGKPAEEIVNLGVTLVPEGRRLFPMLTVEENLELGAYRPEARSRLDANKRFCFEAFPILEERRGQQAGSMSGGEQQMLAMGRALMTRPRMIMIDEPSLGLSPRFVTEVFELIVSLSKKGLTIMVVEQNAARALEIADRGYVLELGRNRFEGTGQELLDNQDVRRMYLGG